MGTQGWLVLALLVGGCRVLLNRFLKSRGDAALVGGIA